MNDKAVLGYPCVTDGKEFTHKSKYVQKLMESEALQKRKIAENELERSKQFQREVDRILKAIDAVFERARINDNKIHISMRLKQAV